MIICPCARLAFTFLLEKKSKHEEGIFELKKKINFLVLLSFLTASVLRLLESQMLISPYPCPRFLRASAHLYGKILRQLMIFIR